MKRQASTGPRPRGRGNPVASWMSRHKTGLLQRGRARAGAEMDADVVGMLYKPNGFNGAAPARARKFLGRCSKHPGRHWLQRGRARAGAEMRLVRQHFVN